MLVDQDPRGYRQDPGGDLIVLELLDQALEGELSSDSQESPYMLLCRLDHHRLPRPDRRNRVPGHAKATLNGVQARPFGQALDAFAADLRTVTEYTLGGMDRWTGFLQVDLRGAGWER